jgi:glycosyltransferase involved in cell wall biosynthesis
VLLEATKHFLTGSDDNWLVIAGDGPERASLERLARILPGRNRTLFVGFREDRDDILGTLTLLVLPSLSEGLGSVLLEAMRSSVPVVASEVGGVPEVVDHGRSGILIPPGDAASLGIAVRKLLGDGRERARIAEEGLLRLRHFDVRRMVDGSEEVYREILSRYGDAKA